MQPNEILKKWLEYTEYDPERKSFVFGSLTCEYHMCNETISKFMPYNPSGEIAVLYAKHMFQKIMSDTKVQAFSVISQPEQMQPHMDIWNLFCSADVKAIEESVLNDFNELLSKVIPSKMIGERDLTAEREALMGSIEAVVKSLFQCNVELFLRGGAIGRITNFSTHIHVFNQLAECLLTLEGSPDGMYLCYIKDFDSVDGYFGFYLKSNGTILSVNERLHESYPGAFKRHRNKRFADKKQYELFPYNFIFSFDQAGYDYKGYACSHVIDEDQLALFKLEPKAYLPLVIAMVLLRNRYENCDISEMPLLFVDSLLPVNLSLPTPGTEALMVPGTSMIAQVNRGLQLELSSEDVLKGRYNHLLGHPAPTSESTFASQFYEYSDGQENVFIEKYGKGFTLNTETLLESNRHLKQLSAAELATTKLTPNAEFVGTAECMTQIAYMNGRSQLAEYIRDKMFQEYIAFGGKAAIKKWWEKALPTIRDKLIELCVERYKNGTNNSGPVGSGQFTIYMDLDCTSRPYRVSDTAYPFNTWGKTKSGYLDYNAPLCCITGKKVSHYFSFQIDSYEQMVDLLGSQNVPSILAGYKRCGHRILGNSILSVTDPVTGVGTPFEEYEYEVNNRLWTRDQYGSYILSHEDRYPDDRPFWEYIPKTVQEESSVMQFNFVIAFSKRGWAKVLKGER